MTLIEKAIKLRSIIEKAVQYLDDSDALEGASLFPLWEPNKQYEAGSKVRYNDILYKVLTTHQSQHDWTPESAHSLYSRVLISTTGDILNWVQPDSTNPYMKGDKVNHKGKTYESLIDNNVWEPGSIGTSSLWKEL